MNGRSWLLVLLPLFASCNLGPPTTADALFQDYADRIARILELERTQPTPAPVPQLPPRRERLLKITDVQVDILDFLSLYGCDLQVLVGYRNSALGKTMPWSSRWAYEQQFLVQGRACLTYLEREKVDAEVFQALEAALVSKQEQLPRIAWNAIWGAEEIERQFKLNVQPHELTYDAVSAQEAARAWEMLLSLTQAPPKAFDPTQLDQALSRLRSDAAMARLLRTNQLATVWLRQSAAMIEKALARRPLCFNERPSKQAQVMRNLFQGVYAEQVQPYLAALVRARQELLPVVQALVRHHQGVAPPALEPFVRQVLEVGEGSVWADFDRAMADHTQAWQNLFRQCGLMPGGPPT